MARSGVCVLLLEQVADALWALATVGHEDKSVGEALSNQVFRVSGLGFRGWGQGSQVEGSGVRGSGVRVLGLRVEG